VNLSRRAGFDAIDISAFWQRGRTAPAPGTLRGIGNAAAAARHDGMRLFIVAGTGARAAPRTAGPSGSSSRPSRRRS
jgi:hypothetical protein